VPRLVGEAQGSDGDGGLVSTDPALAGKVSARGARAASVVSSDDELIHTELSIDLSASARGRPTTDSESEAEAALPAGAVGRGERSAAA
jgi:hypothetical protein